MIKAGIIGATGYTGAELVRLLHNHPSARIEMMTSTSQAGRRYGALFERFRHTGYVLEADDWEQMAERCDCVFLALPHGIAMRHVAQSMLDKCKVIDLGADFRLKDPAVYEDWYGLPLDNPALLTEAVYGLTEINRADIQKSRLIANPGCYTTCAILALYPLLKAGLIEPNGIIIDAKSGASGAGRSASVGNLFCEVDESIKAYGVPRHRHTPEIEQALSVAAGQPVVVTFTPHLVPMARGILSVAYSVLKPHVDALSVYAACTQAYCKEPFIRLLEPGKLPETRHVAQTNFVDIGFTVDARTGRLVVVSALDNLLKGASGQAVQNMNCLFGEDETRGLLF